jgi:hypothetical protein
MRMMMVVPAMLGRKAHLFQGYRQPIPFVNAGVAEIAHRRELIAPQDLA